MENVLKIKFNGGLCNKLFCLFSACDISIKRNIPLLEPIFGWNNAIKFSDIYNIDYFNNQMKPYNNNRNIMIPFNQKHKYKVINNKTNLWNYSESILKVQREQNIMNKNCMNICVLKALKLNNKYLPIINSFNLANNNAIHIRIEKDWQQYSKNQNIKNKELYLVTLDNLISMYLNHFTLINRDNTSIFFTTGENHKHIINKFKSVNINSNYYYNSDFEYELNAAINFELCSNANNFVGLSRSTFTNLISLNRYLLNKNPSLIYNYNNQLIERCDYGLHCEPSNVQNIVSLT